MKAIIATQYGTTDVLKLETNFPKPVKTENQVLVAVKSSSINPVDYMVRAGYLDQFIKFQFPLGMCMDFSGVIEEVAKDGKHKKGDRIYGKLPFHRPGTIQECIILWIGRTSAIQAFESANLEKGSKVFITGGSGGVGPFAIQYAAHVLGLEVHAKAGEAALESLKKLGATKVFDYKKSEWEHQNDVYDFIFLTTKEDTSKLIPIVKKGGYITSITDQKLETDKAKFHWFMLNETHVQFEKLEKSVKSGLVKAVVSNEFPIEQTADAFKLVESGRAKGGFCGDLEKGFAGGSSLIVADATRNVSMDIMMLMERLRAGYPVHEEEFATNLGWSFKYTTGCCMKKSFMTYLPASGPKNWYDYCAAKDLELRGRRI